jgi:hypothetical protein
MSKSHEVRIFRLQVMIDNEELEAVDKWRFDKRMPSRGRSCS